MQGIRLARVHPLDTAYGPYADEFPPTQHKLGPFDPIRTKIRELAPQR